MSKTNPSYSLAQAWADKIEHSIKIVSNMERALLLALSDADIEDMDGEELFRPLGVDLFCSVIKPK